MNLSTTGEMLAQRDAFGDALIELIDRDPRVYVLDGDLANSTKADKVSRERPDRFLEMGIAEQNMMGVAAGMATCGLVPWLSSFAAASEITRSAARSAMVTRSSAPDYVSISSPAVLRKKCGPAPIDLRDCGLSRVSRRENGVPVISAVRAAAVCAGPWLRVLPLPRSQRHQRRRHRRYVGVFMLRPMRAVSRTSPASGLPIPSLPKKTRVSWHVRKSPICRKRHQATAPDAVGPCAVGPCPGSARRYFS